MKHLQPLDLEALRRRQAEQLRVTRALYGQHGQQDGADDGDSESPFVAIEHIVQGAIRLFVIAVFVVAMVAAALSGPPGPMP